MPPSLSAARHSSLMILLSLLQPNHIYARKPSQSCIEAPVTCFPDGSCGIEGTAIPIPCITPEAVSDIPGIGPSLDPLSEFSSLFPTGFLLPTPDVGPNGPEATGKPDPHKGGLGATSTAVSVSITFSSSGSIAHTTSEVSPVLVTVTNTVTQSQDSGQPSPSNSAVVLGARYGLIVVTISVVLKQFIN